jgi:prepilin-type N-terminal cleavage/methylation domain-containing protein
MQTSRVRASATLPCDGRTARFGQDTDRPRRHRHSRGGRGFTLIELLVVVGMMAILAAVLFPVFAQARAQARQSTCASHLAQIARAGLLYLQDYDERFPSC